MQFPWPGRRGRATPRTRFLVGMMYCGENERPQAVAALERQTLASWRLFGIDHLPNKAAHDRLYAGFMNDADRHDFFLKLDADMVLVTDRALEIVAAAFDAAAELEALMYDVHDWYCDRLIPGLTAFRSSVRWTAHDDGLMVDPMPQLTGRAERISGPPAPLAEHCPDPAPLQAFRYGLQRALKMVQADRPVAARDPNRLVLHLAVLHDTWNAFREKGDRRRALAVAGAEFGLREAAKLPGGYAGAAADEMFHARFAGLDTAGLLAYIGSAWDDEARNFARVQALQATPAGD